MILNESANTPGVFGTETGVKLQVNNVTCACYETRVTHIIIALTFRSGVNRMVGLWSGQQATCRTHPFGSVLTTCFSIRSLLLRPLTSLVSSPRELLKKTTPTSSTIPTKETCRLIRSSLETLGQQSQITYQVSTRPNGVNCSITGPIGTPSSLGYTTRFIANFELASQSSTALVLVITTTRTRRATALQRWLIALVVYVQHGPLTGHNNILHTMSLL